MFLFNGALVPANEREDGCRVTFDRRRVSYHFLLSFQMPGKWADKCCRSVLWYPPPSAEVPPAHTTTITTTIKKGGQPELLVESVSGLTDQVKSKGCSLVPEEKGGGGPHTLLFFFSPAMVSMATRQPPWLWCVFRARKLNRGEISMSGKFESSDKSDRFFFLN